MDLRVRIRSRRSSEKEDQSPFPHSTTAAVAATTGGQGRGDEEEEEREGEEEMDEEQPLSPAARLFVQRNFDCHVIAILGLGRPIDVATSISALGLTLGKHPRFCSIMDESGSGAPKWIRTKVCIPDHIVMPPLEEGKELPPDFVEAYVGKITGIPLDKSKPLWELHLLNGKTQDAEATAVLKVHHSLGDGISLLSLLLACTRKVSDPESLPTIPRPRRRGSERKQGLLSFLAGLWLLLQVMWYSFIDCFLLMATALFYKDTNNPIKGSKGMQSRPKLIVHSTLSLDDIKLVKHAVSGTVNDVMLGLATAGLVRYMNRRYAKTNGVDDERPSIPSNIRVRTTLLFNTRETPGLHELAEMMKGNGNVKWGNKLGYMIIPIPMKMHKDPMDYVREAKAIADRKKMSLEAYFSYYGGLLIAKLFGFKLATAMCHNILANTTFSFSTVIGPTEEVEFFGNPIVYIAPTVYGHPHALTIHFQSYVNKVKLVISVDEESVPDPRQLCIDIEECLAKIKNSLNKKIGDKIEILSTQK
ncbi:wax ester synthase/diacylglycerol acyltransferase 11-like [Nymphaea colorata]|nr:wax ester synthase/diacylglycerol acyltransferase 11-like [Nymphaea colorata]